MFHRNKFIIDKYSKDDVDKEMFRFIEPLIEEKK